MFTIPANLIGMIVSGDLDGITIYTDRFGRKVCFPQAPPTSPPSAIQKWNRDRFRTAAQLYRYLSAEQRQALSTVCKKLNLLAVGPSLWTCLVTQPDDTLRATLSRQSGIDLPNPRELPISQGPAT